MLTDTHAHLYDLDHDTLYRRIEQAESAGVSRIINTAVDLTTSMKVLAQCEQFLNLRAAVGISPFECEKLSDSWEQELTYLLGHPAVVALGECGADASNPKYPPLDKQLPLLTQQLIVARDMDLPAVIHSRGAEELVCNLCVDLGVKRAVFHCFTGTTSALKRIVDNGFFVSFSGIVTFARSPLDEQVAHAPVEHILVESDAPYLAPHPFRGQENQPAWIPNTVNALARIKNIEPGTLIAQLAKNVRTAFPRMVS